MSPAPQHVTASSSTSARPTLGASARVEMSSSFADSEGPARRYALIRTDRDWLLHLTKAQP